MSAIEVILNLSLDDGDPSFRERIVHEAARQLLADRDKTRPLYETISEVAKGLASEACQALIESPIQLRDRYGDAQGKPTTLRAVIVDEALKQLKVSRDSYGNRTLLSEFLRDEIRKALKDELDEALKQARAQVRDALSAAVSEAVVTKVGK